MVNGPWSQREKKRKTALNKKKDGKGKKMNMSEQE